MRLSGPLALGIVGACVLGSALPLYSKPVFTNHGIAANAAEQRGVVAIRTASGRNLVLASTFDGGAKSYVLVTDVDSGVTTRVDCPEGTPNQGAFGSLFSANGKLYTGEGRHLLEFDPESMTWTWHGVPCAESNHFMSFAESPDGTVIWAAMNPTTHLVSFDAATRVTKMHVQLDPDEHYPQSLALDADGWVYAGIGTARCNLVAYNPTTGERRQLLPESERKHGTAVVSPLEDGTVLGKASGKNYRLSKGVAELFDAGEPLPKRRNVRSLYYGRVLGQFPDGRRLTRYDMSEGVYVLRLKDGSLVTKPLEFASGGAPVTSVGAGPDGVFYASTCHPMHLSRLASGSADAKSFDLGGIPTVGGGNFCAIASHGKHVYGCEYAGGRLWSYNTAAPWRPGAAQAKIHGVTAADLVAKGRVEDGHFTHLAAKDLAFLCGDRFGAVGHYPISVAADGDYYLQFVPYRFGSYCRVQFRFNGKELGEPFDASGEEGLFPMLTFGPFALKKGAHMLSVETLETPGKRPFFSLATAALSKTKLPALVDTVVSNPAKLAQWAKNICRPRTIIAHPDGKHVIMSGFAGYGYCGGGIGIHSLATGENTVLTAEDALLPGHSCITLKALRNGDLVGGTSVTAPGGGRVKATEAELFVLDWETRTIAYHAVPVPKQRDIISITVIGDRVYGLTANATFFVFDSTTRKIINSSSLSDFGRVPRHALQTDGTRLFALLSKGILQLDPTTFEHTVIARPPAAISAGGAFIDGTFCYAAGTNLWTLRLSGN